VSFFVSAPWPMFGISLADIRTDCACGAAIRNVILLIGGYFRRRDLRRRGATAATAAA
jgi:hypothetical protein